MFLATLLQEEQMIIRTYRDSDREALKEITVTCFDGNSSIDHNMESLFGPIDGRDWEWRKRLHMDNDIAANAAGIFVAEIEGTTIGYINTRVDHETRIGSVPHMAVLPAHRKKGLGRMLLDAAVAFLKDQGMKHIHISTLETNAPSQQLYPSYGFKEVSRQIHYMMPIEDK